MSKDGIKCPACGNNCSLSFTIADKEKTDWVFCSCGTIFHQKKLDKSYFSEEWIRNYLNWKSLDDRYDYVRSVYFPIIQELTYGRRFLEIGFGSDRNIRELSKDGWLATGIDIIKNDYITGDFENYNFKTEQFDVIMISGVIGALNNPIKALYKAKELLREGGILLIMDADAELVYQNGMFNFGNWNNKERWVIFAERQINKILSTLGFNTILSHKNTNCRFMNWNTYHIIAQKRS